MARKCWLLAAGLLVAVGALGRAEDPAPVQEPAQEEAAPAGPGVIEAAPEAAAPCCKCCQGHARGDCLHRLCAWLTYCPPKTPCHCGLHGWCSSCGCGGGGGCGGCGGHKCTPCCLPLYMYFLDRCDCRFGFPPVCCLPNCPPADAGPGPAPQAGERPPSAEQLPAPVPLPDATNPKETSGR